MDFNKACENGCIDEVDNLVITGGQDLESGLLLAAKNGHRAVCDLLIGLGAVVSFDAIKVASEQGFINTTKDLAHAYDRQNGHKRGIFAELIADAERKGYRRTVGALKEVEYGRPS